MKIFRSLALVGALLAAPCFAQLDRGAITGTVTDSSGAVVPGAKIAIRNLATNVKYQSATTGSGDYNAVNLPAGSYEVTFEANGLKTLVRSNIVGCRIGDRPRGRLASRGRVERYGHGDERGISAANR